MKSRDEKHSGWLLIIGITIGVLAVTAGPALAALTFSGTTISGDGAVVIDSSSTISIGTSTATTITIGRLGQATTFPGNVSVGTTAISPTTGVTGPSSVNTQAGTSYTLSASDNGRVLTFNNASAITLTVPAGLGSGFNCLIVQLGAGTVTPTTSGTTIYQRQSLTQTAGQYGVATLVAIAPDTFVLGGDLQ